MSFEPTALINYAASAAEDEKVRKLRDEIQNVTEELRKSRQLFANLQSDLNKFELKTPEEYFEESEENIRELIFAKGK